MTSRKILSLMFVASFLLLLGVIGCAAPQKAAAPAAAEWKFHSIVDVAFVKPYAVVPQPQGVMVVDSRPYKPKYVNGHIPTAVSIPDSQFDKLKGKLPGDKNALLIFYCGGPT